MGTKAYTVEVRMACSTPVLQCRDGRMVKMANTKEQQLQAFARRAARVSKALWPTSVKHAISTGRVAQTRRRLIVLLSMKWLQPGAQRKSFSNVLGKAHFPNTPMPVEPPLVRVLETFDLSQTGVEHFLDLPERGNTGGYSLESWREAQTSLHRTARE
jgi:hypothetical protein